MQHETDWALVLLSAFFDSLVAIVLFFVERDPVFVSPIGMIVFELFYAG